MPQMPMFIDTPSDMTMDNLELERLRRRLSNHQGGLLALRSLSIYRPILIGILLFLVLNGSVALFLGNPHLDQHINAKYGNYLPLKLALISKANPKHLDVLFLGTSQTNNGFDTTAFEQGAPVKLNSFNMGLPGNEYDVMLSYLKAHCQRYGPPKLLLLELSPTIQERDSSHFFIPSLFYRSLMAHYPHLWPFVLKTPLINWNVKQEVLLSAFSGLHQFRRTFSPVSLLTKFISGLGHLADKIGVVSAYKGPLTLEAQPSDPNLLPQYHQDTLKGWSPKPESPLMRTPKGIQQITEEARKYFLDPLPPIDFGKLEAVLIYCRQHRIPVVLVTWPNRPEFVRLYQQSRFYGPFHQGTLTIPAKYHVPYIDLGELPVAVFGNLYADPRHLKPEGAMLYSHRLANELFKQPEVSRLFQPTIPINVIQRKAF